MKMRCSVHLSPRIRSDAQYQPLRAAVMEQALEADRAGFAGLVLTEHHLSTHNPYQNPLLFGCALAPQITRAYIVLATINPAIYHPLRLVESCNFLDQLLEGRLVVAFGPGYFDDELRMFGREPAERATTFQRALETTLAVWDVKEGDPLLEFDVAGERGRVHRPVVPPPFRRPRPILARGTLTETTVAETARRGWPVLLAGLTNDLVASRLRAYHKTLAASGHDAEVIDTARRWTGVVKFIHVAATDADAEAQVRPPLQRLLDEDAAAHKDPTTTLARSTAGRDVSTMLRGSTIYGSPTTVTAELRRLEAAGVGNIIGLFLRDFEELDEARKSFRLFCDQVLPQFSDP